jgi:hypothetical protein
MAADGHGPPCFADLFRSDQTDAQIANNFIDSTQAISAASGC